MNVKIINILDKCRVIVQVESNKFIVEWEGDIPDIDENYVVEMDIDDELIWETNICFSSENHSAIIQKDKGVKIVAKLDYNSEANLAIIEVYESMVLIEIEGIKRDITSEWVEINCHSIKLSDINL